MASLLQQLQSGDTLLLMYLADELPAADRAEVERRVAGDAKLRADLDRLAEAYDSFTSGMRSLDDASPIQADVSAAVRRASSAIRQWQARPAPASTPSVADRSPRRWRLWVIPSAAAAIVLVVLGVSLYSGSAPGPRVVQLGRGFPSSAPLANLGPSVSPQEDETARMLNLFQKTTPTGGSPETDALVDAAGPGFDQEIIRDEADGNALPEDGALFNVPLP